MMSYLQEEGLKCEVSGGDVIFEYKDCFFNVHINLNDGFGECSIVFECEDEEYEKLDQEKKAFMADKVNVDTDNHATIIAYQSSFEAKTSFYFTNKGMLLNLFSSHFEELTDSVCEAIDIVGTEIEEQKQSSGRRIGFNTETYQIKNQKPEEVQIAAKA